MPLLDLILLATCEGVKQISVPEDNEWHFRVKCTHCNEPFEHTIYFRDSDKVEHKTEVCNRCRHSAFANFVAKCKGCKRVSCISTHKETPRVVQVPENGRAKGILGVFDCRGLEIIGFEPGNTLSAVINSGKSYENIDVRYYAA